MRTDAGVHGSLPRVCVVGPLPPPSGGMAHQCEQLARLLAREGVPVEVVANNAPYRPAWAGRIPVLRALVRLLPYCLRLWQAAGRSQVVHVLANSGWAWHLFAAPALWVARARGRPVIVNYRGGLADAFLSHAPAHVRSALGGATLRVTPSAFLGRVFARHGLDARVIPNIIDVDRFVPAPPREVGNAPELLVTRNLERIYDIPTALRALARVREQFPAACLTVAGSGPEREALLRLAAELGLGDAVRFPGRIDNAEMPALYARADVAVNPSTVDNMPNSILEAFASGVPVVSTDAGGVPDVVEHGVSGLLVPVGDDAAMAESIVRVLQDRRLAADLIRAGLEQAQRYSWPSIRQQWLTVYCELAGESA